MTWEEFVALVDGFLATDAGRRGIEIFRAQYIVAAVTILQRFIESYRLGNTTTYTLANVTPIGAASLVSFPSGAKPKEIYIFSTAPGSNPYQDRHRLDYYPWKHRNDLIDGRMSFQTWWNNCSVLPCGPCVGQIPGTICPVPVVPAGASWGSFQRKGYVYTIAPHGLNCLVYPPLNSCTNILLVWDGFKTTFADTDMVPYPVEAAQCVAEFIKWKIFTYVDKNPTLAQLAQKDWLQGRLELYRDWQETQDMEAKGEEYDDVIVAPPTNFGGFGTQSIPLMTTITALAGTTANCLAAIPTATIPVGQLPITVLISISGGLQIWTLQAGTAPTGSGIQQPNDYNATTNPNEWVQTP